MLAECHECHLCAGWLLLFLLVGNPCSAGDDGMDNRTRYPARHEVKPRFVNISLTAIVSHGVARAFRCQARQAHDLDRKRPCLAVAL